MQKEFCQRCARYVHPHEHDCYGTAARLHRAAQDCYHHATELREARPDLANVLFAMHNVLQAARDTEESND